MPPATNSSQALNNLQTFQQNEQTPQQAFSSTENTLGVPQAQQQVSGLQKAVNNTTNLLNQVAPSVEGRTQNSLVTQAQATKQIGNESAPIQQNLSKDTADYNSANSNYSDLLQQAETLANADLSQQTGQLGALQNTYSDLAAQEAAQQQQSNFEQQLAADQAQAAAATKASAASSNGGYTDSLNSVGGLAFSDPSGNPITLEQYINDTGGNTSNAIALLQRSKDPTDAYLAQDLQNGVPIATLAKAYPYVFGG